MLDIFELGVWAMVAVGFMAALTMLILHIMAQRSQQHMAEQSQANQVNLLAQGLQAMTGVNIIQTVDKSIENQPKT